MPITVFGDGLQTRDFVYVGDLVKVLLQAIDNATVFGGAVNVGLNRSTTLLSLLDVIGEVIGSLPSVSHVSARSGDARHSRANTDRLLRHYNVPDPPVSMRDGLVSLLGG
jgi:UDP-glucose 4-epimerase